VASFSFEPAEPTATEAVDFRDASKDVDDDAIAGWSWDFGDGATSNVARPEHVYAAAGTYFVSLEVSDVHGASSDVLTRTVIVGDALPTARLATGGAEGLALRGTMPVAVSGDVVLDASGSTDVEGKIVSYGWDLDNDGTMDEITTKPTLTASFPNPGEYTIGLSVTDEYGNVSTTTLTLEIVSSLSVVRTIDTYLPSDETIAGAVVQVTITISANAPFEGLAVSENVPSGWTFSSIETDGALLKTSTPTTTAEWVFVDRIRPEEKSQRIIRYQLTSPSTGPTEERQFVTLHGNVFSASPRIAQTTLGEDKITVLKYLSVPVAISCWDAKAATMDLRLGTGGMISYDQMQYAVVLWSSGGVVPRTNNGTIGLATLSDLIAYWSTKTSVYDPLP